MRILVIGGTGFSGPFAVRCLSDMGHELLLFHRGQTETFLPDSVRYIHGNRQNLTDFAAELRRFAPHLILDMIPANERQAHDVVKIFRGIARRVVALSSQDVYRAYGKIIGFEAAPVERIPLDEDSHLRAKLYPYRGKAKGEDDPMYHYDKILVEKVFMGSPELPGTILRLPMVYGPRDRQRRLFNYLKRMDDGRPAIILEAGYAAWRWTKGYCENIAAAIVLAVTDERAAGRIYNVGEPETLSQADWVRAIGKAAGWTGKVVALTKDRLPKHLISDIDSTQDLITDTSRIRKELGYKETMSCEEALRRTVVWERANPPKEIDPAMFDYAAEDAILKAEI